MALVDVLGTIGAVTTAEGKRSDIGGSQRHIWFAHIDDETRLKEVAGIPAANAAATPPVKTTKEQEVQAKRAEAILKAGNQAPAVEKAFGPLSGLEETLTSLAKKSGVFKAGDRYLMSLTEKEFTEMVATLKAAGK